jgi:small-conductance mechanosensitive channel
MMPKISYRCGLVLLLACALLLGAAMLPVGIPPGVSMPALIAQDATSTPAPTVEGTPAADATATVEATPAANATATVEATPGADIASSIEDMASEAVSGFDDLTWGTFDDALLEALRPQLRWLIAAVGFQLATLQLEFLSGFWQDVLQLTYFLLYWFVAMSTLWHTIDVAVQWYIERKGPDIDPNVRDQLLPLAARLGHGCLLILAIGTLLGYFGVNMLAITAAMGLGGFAISLAAKDTITNVISGIVIMFDSPFKVGDRIDVPSAGTWGDVVDIGIRSTRVQTRDNRLVIIPNASVVDGEVINYSQPDPSYRLQVDLGISYNGDIPSITKVLEETIRGVEGVMEDKPGNVLFTGFGDAGMDIRVRWWVKSPGDKRSVTHRVCSAIQDITVEKDIDMPNKTYSLVNTLKINPEDLDELSQSLNAPVHVRSDASTVDGDQDSSSEAAN